MIGWFQAAVASLIAGSVVPGLATPARIVILAAISLGAAAVWMPHGSKFFPARRSARFFVLFSVMTGAWLCVMMYGTYIWNLCLAYYRVLGIGMSLFIVGVAALCWLTLARRECASRAGHPLADRDRAQVRLLVLLCAGVELSLQPRSLGTRNRPVDSAEMDPVHSPRVAGRPGVLHEAHREAVTEPPVP